MKNDQIILLLLIAGGGWFLYTRSQGLTLTGEPLNPMMNPAAGNKQSLVTGNVSTSTLATNVFTTLTKSLQAFAGFLTPKPGNASQLASPSSTISPRDVASWGLQVPRDEPAPYVAATSPSDDGTLNTQIPFWSWNPTMGVPAMPWTLNPAVLGFDPNYIPPPPGR